MAVGLGSDVDDGARGIPIVRPTSKTRLRSRLAGIDEDRIWHPTLAFRFKGFRNPKSEEGPGHTRRPGGTEGPTTEEAAART